MIALMNPVVETEPAVKLMDQAGFQRLMLRAKISKAISGKNPSEYGKAIAEALGYA